MRSKKQLFLFFVAIACIAAGSGIHESVFNNFLSDTFHLPASQRGLLEFPRETPGLLVALVAGMLFLLPETAMGTVGALIFCFGMVGMSQFGHNYGAMVTCMVLGSVGQHLLMPVGSSVAIALAEPNQRGRRLGQMAAMGTAGMMLGSGFVWLGLGRDAQQYRVAFMAIGVAAAAGGLFYGRMRIPSMNKPKPRLLMRRKFWLYYSLEFIYGARKQIFITFGPWVLVRIYGLPATEIAKLLFIASSLGLIWKPLAGMLIDRFGERRVLVADGLVLCLVCVGYGYAMVLADSAKVALLIASACYILDELLFSLSTARTVYASRLADSSQELTSTLAMGISINHISSMIIPIFAGALWMAVGYERVFLAAAMLALGIAGMSRLLPLRKVEVPDEIPEEIPDEMETEVVA